MKRTDSVPSDHRASFFYRGINLFASCLALFFALNISPAAASPQSWQSLTPSQQEALAPLSKQWGSLPKKQQRRLLNVAKHYPGLTAEEKKRFLSRIEAWSKLTPKQRQAARDKYRAFSQVPEDTRKQVKKIVEEDQVP